MSDDDQPTERIEPVEPSHPVEPVDATEPMEPVAATASMEQQAPPSSRPRWLVWGSAATGAVLVIVAITWSVARATAPDGDDAVAASSTPTASPTPTSSAAPEPLREVACRATADVTNSWDGGFQMDVTVTAAAGNLTSWTVGLDLADATVDGAWNSTLSPGAKGTVEASNVDYNGTLAEKATTTFGFTASGEPEVTVTSCIAEGEATANAGSGEDAGADGEGPTDPEGDVSAPVNPASGDDWLSVDGNRIVDANGNEVWLTGANWFGFNTSERVFHGLWSVNLDDTVESIARRGINVLRVPISTELLLEWRAGKAQTTGNVNAASNPDLEGKTTLQVFDAFLSSARDNGVKVILDVHSAKADNAGHVAPVWYAGDISTEDFMVAWEWVAERYREDDTIIGFDLENEPHGKAPESPRATWGGGGKDDWLAVASEAAERIHAVHPDALLLVEGIESTPKDGRSWSSNNPGDYDITWWGGNLRLAGDQPVTGADDKILYSPHDYGPLVFDQPWFQGSFSAASLERDVWGPTWLYLHDDGIAPLLIGEWGGRLGEDDRQDRWMTYLRDLIEDRQLHHTFWCINPNSGDTGGLLLDDWTSWDEDKYALIEPVLWQDGDGRFISLDHEVPLPGGTTVKRHYGG